MDLRLCFENLPEYNLQTGDRIYVVVEKVGPKGIIFIRRKEGSEFASGIYSCKTGELLLSEFEFDDIQVVTNSGYHGSEFYYRILKDGKVGACSMDGRLVLEPEQMDITDFVDGVLVVKTEKKCYAACSDTGEELLPPKYTTMKREKSFIVASIGGNVVSVIFRGKVLVEDVHAPKISKLWQYLILHLEKSILLVSVKGTVKEFEGTARARQGDCIEITKGNQKGIVYALDGSYVIPMGEYRSIRKREAYYYAERSDGSIIEGKIPW